MKIRAENQTIGKWYDVKYRFFMEGNCVLETQNDIKPLVPRLEKKVKHAQ